MHVHPAARRRSFRSFVPALSLLPLVSLLSASAARADVKLPLLLSDGCVLQQKAPVRVWGTAAPGEKVTVRLQDKTASAVTGPDGKFAATLKDLKPGGPFTMTVQGNNRVEVKDVLVGEVWVCSGQSNMEWPLAATTGGPVEIAGSADPQLRMFTVTKAIRTRPQDEVAGGTWQAAGPKTSGGFSAVGYHFAKSLRQARKVPIGMIHSSWGGTRIETWIARQALKEAQTPAAEFTWMDAPSDDLKAAEERYQKALAAWKAAGGMTGEWADPGIAEKAKGWEAFDLVEADWGTVRLPAAWDALGQEDLTNIDGGVWFRREFEVPAAAKGIEAVLTLGAIDDFDQTFVNGVKVGSTGPEVPQFWQHPRRYTVPAGVLKAGRNVVAVRAWDHTGGGGLMGPADEMKIVPAGAPPVSLGGVGWRYKVEASRLGPPAQPAGLNPQSASALYNAMLHPLTPYAIRGAIWYQGESNAGAPGRYRLLMPTLIQNWRTAFNNPAMGFYMVQLAPFKSGDAKGEAWPLIGEAQVETASLLPGVGVAVTTDVGDPDDIHPRNKRPVGERLALLARRTTYGEKIVSQGPTLKDFERNVDNIAVTFDNVGAGLEARGHQGQLVGWEIAGGDGKYFPATAVVQGKDKVVVMSPEVSVPFHVRYGWANVPTVNLFNREGLPARPFRTDVPLVPVDR